MNPDLTKSEVRDEQLAICDAATPSNCLWTVPNPADLVFRACALAGYRPALKLVREQAVEIERLRVDLTAERKQNLLSPEAHGRNVDEFYGESIKVAKDKRIAELEAALSQLRAEFTIRTDALVEGRAKVTEQMAEIAQLETVLAGQEHRPFRFAVCDVLGECTSCLPAGETWAATDDGVIQYIKDIVAALAYTTDSRDEWMRVTSSRQEQIVELEVALGCAGKKIHEDEGTILQLQEGVIRSTRMIAGLQVALTEREATIEQLRAELAEARTHYGCGPGRRYRFDGGDFSTGYEIDSDL